MLYLLSLITFLLPSYLIRFKILGIPTTLLEILIYLTFLIYLFWLIKNKALKNLRFPLILPIALLFLASLISVYICPDKIKALGILKGFIFDPILLFFLIINLVKTQKQAQKIIWALIGSGIFVSLHALYQYFTQELTPDGRVIGIFGYSPNYLALYLAPIIVLLTAYCLFFANHKRKILLTFPFFLLTFILYLSGSRGGYLAVAVGIFVLAYFYLTQVFLKHKKIVQIAFLILLLLGLFSFFELAKPDFSLSPEEGARITSSNNLRWEIWKTSFEILKEKPILGVGLSNFQNYFGELTKERVNFPEFITPYALTPHNIFLAFWLNLGILGLISFLWLLCEFFKKGLKLLTSYSLTLISVMIAILAHGLVDTPYFKNDLSCLFWILMGLMIIYNKEKES